MPLRELLRLLKYWWIVVLVAVAAAVGAYGMSKLQQPMFRSDVRILVKIARSDFGLTEASRSLLGQLGQWLLTRTMADQVIAERKLAIGTDTLLSRARVYADQGNFAVQLSVEDPDAGTARAVARTWAQDFVEIYNQRNADIDRRDRITLVIYDDATPASLARPRTKVNVLAGGILGGFLGLLIALALEFLNDTIKTSQDVGRYVGLTTLGAIPPS